MNSMTGFSLCRSSGTQTQITVEFKSYNNRYLELFCHLPSEISSQESWSREEITGCIQRGKINVCVKITCLAGKELVLNSQKVHDFIRLQQQLASLGILADYTFSDLQNYGIFEESADSESDLIPLYRQVFKEALQELRNSRALEGASLHTDLCTQIQSLKQLLEQVKSLEKQADSDTAACLREKFRELVGDPIPEQKVLEEIAAYLIKVNIHEEIIRLETHIGSLENLLEETQPVGRKIDFLCQELQRETTTLTNKTPCAHLQQIGVEMKNIIEKIREQARNVE